MCNYLSCILVSAMAGAVSHQPLNVEAQVQYQASPCGIHGGQSSSWLAIFLSRLCLSFAMSVLVVHTHISFSCHQCCTMLALYSVIKHTQL